jgi:CRP/FNR family transcriptional regulator, cyclic AMP receptor protein
MKILGSQPLFVPEGSRHNGETDQGQTHQDIGAGNTMQDMQEVIFDTEGLPEKNYKKGDVIFAEGREGSEAYILKEGSVSVTAGGNEICKVNHPGTIIGEISVLLEGEYSATVTAQEDTIFYVIDDLFGLFKTNPEICMNVAKLLALRLVNMNHHFAEIKYEIEMLQTNASTKQASSKLHRLMLKMDQFWGRDVLNPFGKKR